MVFFAEEEEFVDQKKVRQRIGSGKEIMARDLESKKKMEKFYLNPNYWLSDIQEWTTKNKGFSIYRFQLPQLISALQNIIDGKYDVDMSSKISKLINPKENTESNVEQEIDSEEKTEDIVPEENRPIFTPEIYDEWFSGQPEKKKKEILELEKYNWTKEKIFNTLNSKDYRDCFE